MERNGWRSAVLTLWLPVLLGAPCLIAGCAGSRSAGAAKPDAPPELRVSGSVVGRAHATGFQVYTAQPDGAGRLAWKFKGPEATFTGPSGLKGKHYAGATNPVWENTGDGSKVIGHK